MLSSWKGCCGHVPQRWIFAGMGLLAMMNMYTMRICLSLVITEMVKSSVTTSNSTLLDETCPSTTSISSNSSTGGTYEWDEYTQGIILSSYSWGSIIMQLPGGILAQKFGGKYICGLGIFSMAIFTLLTPIIVRVYDSTGLIILRVMMGFGDGFSAPAINFLIAQWAPPNDRSRIGAVVFSGASVGTFLGNALTGLLIEYSFIGWPIVFYFFGVLGILWFFAWVVLCYNHPEVHPFISDKEKNYLHNTMSEHTHRLNSPTPWRHIMTSVPVWALMAAKFGYGWGFYTLVTDLPKYMSSVLKFSVKANGLLTALPYILKLIFSYTLSWLADWLISDGKMSRTNVRKLWVTIIMVGPAVFIIAASYAGCDRTIVVIFFTVGITLMGPVGSSLLVNANDLSPNYSATLAAMGGVFTSVAGIFAPYLVGVLTPNQTLPEWRIVFGIAFVLFLSTTLIFDIWGQGEVQFWNDSNISDNRQDGTGREKQATVVIEPSSKQL